jgi:hypothetical protein
MLAFVSVMHKTSVLTSQRTHPVPSRKSAANEIFDIEGEIIPHEQKNTNTMCGKVPSFLILGRWCTCLSLSLKMLMSPAMIQAVCRRLFTAHARIKSSSIPCETSSNGVALGQVVPQYCDCTSSLSTQQCPTFILSYHQTHII